MKDRKKNLRIRRAELQRKSRSRSSSYLIMFRRVAIVPCGTVQVNVMVGATSLKGASAPDEGGEGT